MILLNIQTIRIMVVLLSIFQHKCFTVRRACAAHTLFRGADVLAQCGAPVPKPVRPAGCHRRFHDLLFLCLHQYVDGHGPFAGRRRAAAAGLLWRHGDALAHVRLRAPDERSHPPESGDFEGTERVLVGRGDAEGRLFGKRRVRGWTGPHSFAIGTAPPRKSVAGMVVSTGRSGGTAGA